MLLFRLMHMKDISLWLVKTVLEKKKYGWRELAKEVRRLRREQEETLPKMICGSTVFENSPLFNNNKRCLQAWSTFAFLHLFSNFIDTVNLSTINSSCRPAGASSQAEIFWPFFLNEYRARFFLSLFRPPIDL